MSEAFLRISQASLAFEVSRKPSVTSWSRVEPRPVNADFSRALAAPVADPLWLLTRQWQFGEWRGEDAGAPRQLRMAGESMPVTGWRPGGAGKDVLPLDDAGAPLEAVVEDDAPQGAERRRALAAGLQLRRRLLAAGLGAQVQAFRAAFPLALPEPVDALLDARGSGWRALTAMEGAIDGAAAVAAMADARAASGGASSLPVALSGSADAAALEPVCAALLADFPDLAAPPQGMAGAWNPARQEYAFGVEVEDAQGRHGTLLVEEHHGRSLDWPDFDLVREPMGEAASAPRGIRRRIGPLLPTPARYPGMPAPRHWEFEDSRVFLGRLDAGPTDVGRLLLIEFALTYGEDWFIAPLEVEAGSLFALDEMTVQDDFGVTAQLRPLRLGRRAGGPFALSRGARDQRLVGALFTPPTSIGAITGPPIEEVLLLRDELANLGWGVERRVAGTCGGTVDPRLLATRSAAPRRPLAEGVDAQLVYRLQVPAPENWHPLAPVSVSAIRGDIAFERFEAAALNPDGTVRPVTPRGMILSDPVPWRLEEQELPREGASLARAYRMARGRDGRLRLWLGRGKTAGTGEGRSGLRHDESRPASA